MKRFALAIVFTLIAAQCGFTQAGLKPFQDGDTVCFLGDSITHGGLYHKYIADFYATRFPTKKIKTINCGVGGDTAANALARLEWDVLAHQPTVITIMLGMNDVGHSNYADPNPTPAMLAARQKSLDVYAEEMEKLLTAIEARSKARLILIKPSPYDETAEMAGKPGKRGPNAGLAKCAAMCDELAAKHHTEVVDFHGPMTRMNLEGQKSDPKFTLCGADRVHPGPSGHLVMAALFLQAQGLAQPVASVTLDVNSRTLKADNAKAHGLTGSPGKWSFDLTENALPFPVSALDPILKQLMPVDDLLNVEQLTVQGLADGAYRLSIDGVPAGVFASGEQIAMLNIASLPDAPQVKQAAEVEKLGGERYAQNQVLRTIARMKKISGLSGMNTDDDAALRAYIERRQKALKPGSSEITALQGEVKRYDEAKAKLPSAVEAMEELRSRMYEASQPRRHTWVIEKL